VLTVKLFLRLQTPLSQFLMVIVVRRALHWFMCVGLRNESLCVALIQGPNLLNFYEFS